LRYIHGIFLLLLLLGMHAFAADWPFFLGPNHTGISPEKGINKTWKTRAPKALWKTPMSDEGYAGPSVVGNMLYIVDHTGDQDIVRALNLTNGKKVWEYKYKDAAGSNYGFTRSTPVLAGGKVYTVSRLGLVLCLDAKSGKRVWSRSLLKDLHGRKPTWDYSMSVLIDGKKVIVVPGAGSGTVAALDAATGKTIWQGGGNDIPGYATPVLATINKVRQYVVFTGKSLIGVDTNSGKLLWRCPWETSNDVNAACPIVSGNHVFITSDYGKGCALVEVVGKTAKIKWQNRSIMSHFSAPIFSNGFIYSTSDPGKLVCMEFATGKVRWEQRGFEKGGVSAADGVLLAFEGNTGNLVMVKMAPDKYTELGRFRPLGGQSWTAPVMANGKLIIRNQKTLACLALK